MLLYILATPTYDCQSLARLLQQECALLQKIAGVCSCRGSVDAMKDKLAEAEACKFIGGTLRHTKEYTWSVDMLMRAQILSMDGDQTRSADVAYSLAQSHVMVCANNYYV